MTDIAHTLVAKSDQLNASDLTGTEKLLTITSVDVRKGDQPVTIHYEGEEGRPWKPCLTVRRILSQLWTTESENWIGKSVAVHRDPTVKWAGEPHGGIRPHAASGLDATVIVKLKEERGGKPKAFEIKPLRMSAGTAKSEPVQFSMETYERAVSKIIAESKTAEELSTRFDRMTDWRKQAAQTDREAAGAIREKVNEKLAELGNND
jgi:hypothetical protein